MLFLVQKSNLKPETELWYHLNIPFYLEQNQRLGRQLPQLQQLQRATGKSFITKMKKKEEDEEAVVCTSWYMLLIMHK